MEVEEEESGPPTQFLWALGLVAIIVIGLVVAALVVPLQPGLSEPAVTQTAGTVVIPPGTGANNKLNYDPFVITVYLGFNSTVTFDNKDTATHTVTAKDRSFDSGDIKGGQAWTHDFSGLSPGNYSFYCIYHGWMQGTVIVKAGGPTQGATIKIPPGTATNQLNYAPSHFTVVIGVNNTVTFLNQDTAVHTVTANGGSFNSGDIDPGHSWTHVFNTTGTFSFHCIYHSFMTGQITVVSG